MNSRSHAIAHITDREANLPLLDCDKYGLAVFHFLKYLARNTKKNLMLAISAQPVNPASDQSFFKVLEGSGQSGDIMHQKY